MQEFSKHNIRWVILDEILNQFVHYTNTDAGSYIGWKLHDKCLVFCQVYDNAIRIWDAYNADATDWACSIEDPESIKKAIVELIKLKIPRKDTKKCLPTLNTKD